jgi:peptidyl-prolyl cis-trans isomerase A (cyclophilin A)
MPGTSKRRASVRIYFSICLLVSAVCSAGWSQTAPAAKAAPARKPAAAAAAKPATAAAAGPTAIIDTTAGKLTCTLFPDQAPIGVGNFVGLAQGTKDWTNPVSHAKKHGVPLYDGTIFHRVIPSFMIQGGDPAGTGSGEIGFAFKNETSPSLKFDRPGRLAYANAGPDTNGSQFFITEVPYPHLNGGYTIFGQCDEATVVLVKQIAGMGRDSNDRPYRPVKINHITITKGGAAAAKPAAAKPATAAKPAAKKPAAPAPQ